MGGDEGVARPCSSSGSVSVAEEDEAIGVGRRFWSREERRLGAARVVADEDRRRRVGSAAGRSSAAAVVDGSGSGGGPPRQRACSLVVGMVAEEDGRKLMKTLYGEGR